ncbi:MAG: hypothetical protein CM1200mP41_02130 [Gammaproteobacteria bacterium]|nr:MAG: hypothetical protein CM1200mP41_02130 [Gammaproteobacteria bacterium]
MHKPERRFLYFRWIRNSNVHCFGADGVFRFSWGRQGKWAGGKFTTPHAVWVDSSERVLVADRENNRVQLFDLEGASLRHGMIFIIPWISLAMRREHFRYRSDSEIVHDVE